MRIYDPSGDSTIPSTSKKRKFEEMEEAADEPATPVVKSKKAKKEVATEGGWNRNKKDLVSIQIFHDAKGDLSYFACLVEEEAAAEETPKKKKKKKDKKAEAEAEEPKEEEEVTEVWIYL